MTEVMGQIDEIDKDAKRLTDRKNELIEEGNTLLRSMKLKEWALLIPEKIRPSLYLVDKTYTPVYLLHLRRAKQIAFLVWEDPDVEACQDWYLHLRVGPCVTKRLVVCGGLFSSDQKLYSTRNEYKMILRNNVERICRQYKISIIVLAENVEAWKEGHISEGLTICQGGRTRASTYCGMELTRRSYRTLAVRQELTNILDRNDRVEMMSCFIS